MNFIRKLSLKDKIISISMLVASVVFLLATAFLICFQIYQYRINLVQTIDAVATVNSFHNKSALEFDDREAATKGLASFIAEPTVLVACIFNKDGDLFAEFKRSPKSPSLNFEIFNSEKIFYVGDYFYFSKEIRDGDESLGTIAIQVDLVPFYSSLKLAFIAGLVFLFVALLLSFLLARGLQKFVTKPIVGLVETSKIVSSTNDYSVRAAKVSFDETGLLVDAFNEMLTQIEERDKELSEKGEQLSEALEQSKSVSKAKSTFLATISHEIRTPLNGIQGSLHVIKAGELPSRIVHFIDIALRSCESLSAIINDVLDLSKIEAGKMSFELKNVNILNLVNQVLDMQRTKAQEKKLFIGSIISPEVPEVITSDQTRLLQILVNLVGNALKFTAKGSVVLNVSTNSYIKDSCLLRFEISDTGIGIPKDKCAHLFSPFMQADASTTRKFGGTGLGLAICKELVELMGGEIGFESKENVGSTFWFQIPVKIIVPNSIQLRKEYVLSEVSKSISVLSTSQSFKNLLAKQFNLWGLSLNELNSSDQLTKLLNDTHGKSLSIILTERDLVEKIASQFSDVSVVYIAPVEAYEEAVEAIDGYPNVQILHYPVHASGLFNCLFSAEDKNNKLSAIHGVREIRNAFDQFPDARVLVADDNEINRIVVCELLKSFSIKATVVVDGKQAVDIVKDNDFDLIFMDLHMPILDGFEATRLIREFERSKESEGNKQKRLALVALTADVNIETRDKCLGAGMDSFLGKPMDPKKLEQVLIEYLGKV